MWNGFEGVEPILRVPDRWEHDERDAYTRDYDDDIDDDADDDCDDIDEDGEAWEEYTASKKWDKIN